MIDIYNNKLDNIEYIKYLSDNNISNTLESSYKLDYWNFITMDYIYYTVLYPLYERFNCRTIIDIGCGAGNVLRYAKNIGYETTGVDFEDFSIYNKDHIFIHKDIRDLDIKTYSQYDVIYIALPLKIGKGFEEYIKIIQDNMNINQYIITPLYIIEDNRFERIDQHTFIKKTI
jgi:SAM-dependent methyltransferase